MSKGSGQGVLREHTLCENFPLAAFAHAAIGWEDHAELLKKALHLAASLALGQLMADTQLRRAAVGRVASCGRARLAIQRGELPVVQLVVVVVMMMMLAVAEPG